MRRLSCFTWNGYVAAERPRTRGSGGDEPVRPFHVEPGAFGEQRQLSGSPRPARPGFPRLFGAAFHVKRQRSGRSRARTRPSWLGADAARRESPAGRRLAFHVPHCRFAVLAAQPRGTVSRGTPATPGSGTGRPPGVFHVERRRTARPPPVGAPALGGPSRRCFTWNPASARNANKCSSFHVEHPCPRRPVSKGPATILA